MANPVKGEASFEADGKTYTLVFDFNAICVLEEAFDADINSIGELIGTKATSVRKVFQVGLCRHHPDITELEAGDLISVISPAEAGALIKKAFALSFPAPEAAKGAARPRTSPSRSGTG